MGYVKNKFISILLLLTILSTSILMPTVYASEEWSGETAISFAGGNGTQDSPYLISNGEEFMYLASLATSESATKNKYYRLTNDIDFDNKQISTIKRFSGYLNGAGHTIKNINIYSYFEGNSYSGTSLIEYNYGEIRNLNIENLKLTGNKCSSVGGLCLYNNGIIEFCSFDGTMLFKDLTSYPRSVGGLCAENHQNGIIRYCQAKLYGVSSAENGITYFGGIAGQNDGKIIQCEARGDVDIYTTEAHAIGGIVGESEGSIEDSYSQLDLCVENSKMKNLYVGGIVGYSTAGTIERCGAKGIFLNVTQDAPEGYVSSGGIAGYLKTAVKNCYFIGGITVNHYAQTSMSHGIGGLVGEMANYSTIDNSYADASINRFGDGNQPKNYVAGIAGYAPVLSKINNCFADVSIANNGTGTTGVIAGRENTYMAVNNCYYGSNKYLSGSKTVYSGTGVNTSYFKDKNFLVNTVGLKEYTASDVADAVWLYEESGYNYPEVYSGFNAVIYYDANGGENAPSGQMLKYLTDDGITADVPTRGGCSFKGWSYTQTSNNTIFEAGDKTDAFFLMGHITLYAIWEKVASLYVSSVKYEDGIFTANVDTIELEEKSNVYFGVYDKVGNMKAVVSKPVDAGNSSFDISTQEKLDGYEYNVKLMLWNKNMVPDGKMTQSMDLRKINVDTVLESSHPYPNNANETREYKYNGTCKSISVTFSPDTYVENKYDYIYIYNASNGLVGKYTGDALAGKTITVTGNAVKINLTSEASYTYYGYRTESIVVNR